MTEEEILLDWKRFFTRFNEIPRFERKANIFEIMGFSHYENKVSNLLQFYMDPTNEHGFVNMFLEALFKIVIKDYKYGGFHEVSVRREETTSKGNRIDIVIETAHYIIGIENKIFHYLANDLNDYKEHLDQLNKDNKKKVKGVVLSLNGISKPHELKVLKNNDFYNLSYKDYFKELKKYYTDYMFGANTKFLILLNDFMDSVQNLSNNNLADNKMWDFMVKNASTIIEFQEQFRRFEQEFLKTRAIELESKTTNEGFSKKWIWDKHTLVFDFQFEDKVIAVDIIISLKGYEITIFGRDNEAHEKLLNPAFLKELELNPNPILDDNERIKYKTFDLEANEEDVVNEINNLVKKLFPTIKPVKQEANT